MPHIVICAALHAEMAAFVSALRAQNSLRAEHALLPNVRIYEGSLDSVPVILAVCGVGKALAALGCQRTLDFCSEQGKEVSHIIMTGMAGALNPDLKIGDVVAATDCIQHDVDIRAMGYERGEIPQAEGRNAARYWSFESDSALLSLALSYTEGSADSISERIIPGRILTGDQFVALRDSSEYAYLRDELKGDAVEMEGAAVAMCAALNDIPFLLLRTISDTADSGAKINYREFLPRAGEKALGIVRYICANLLR